MLRFHSGDLSSTSVLPCMSIHTLNLFDREKPGFYCDTKGNKNKLQTLEYIYIYLSG